MYKAYTWNEPKQANDKDKYDLEFESGKCALNAQMVFAYHKHGGYYGYFKPSLDEIIKIGYDHQRSRYCIYHN